MLTKSVRIGQFVAADNKVLETRDSHGVRRPDLWTWEFLQRRIGVPLAKLAGTGAGCSVCIDAT
jgi:hypothetical protein